MVSHTADNNVQAMIEKRIAEFTQQTGVSADKARQLVSAIQQAAQVDIMMADIMSDDMGEGTHKEKEPAKRKTRTLSPETERIRKALLTIRPALKKPVTAPELSELLGSSLNTVNNTLRYYESEGIVRQAGKGKQVGRGKQPILWQFQ